MTWLSAGGIVVACFTTLPQSIFASDCTNIFQNLSLFVGVLIVIAGGLKWLWKNVYYKHGNFQLTFFSSLPPKDTDIVPLAEIKEIPLGENQLFVRIRSLNAFQLSEVSFRCVNEDGTNVSLDTLVLKDLQDIYKSLTSVKMDFLDGIEGRYEGRVSGDPGECLHFNIGVYAKQKWSGLLRFKGKDDSGFESYAQHKLRIVPIDKTYTLPRI